MKPLISVIIPTYQHAGTIGACIDSVLAQTYSNVEIIVVNDGSTDNTVEALEPYQDRITLVNQENQGSNPARNRGFREAHGDFLIFCDADVHMQTQMLEKLHAFLQNDLNVSYAYSSFRFGWKKFKSFPFDPDRLRRMNYIHTSSLIRRSDFPGFDNDIKRLQDWDVWLTMLESGKKGVYVPEELFQCVEEKGRVGISSWTPSFMYKIPWKVIGWAPKKIKKYQAARDILFKKHGISL